MTDLSELAKRLQEQVDVITKHLEKEKLPAPSFIPSASEDPLKSTMQSLPADVDKARKKAQALSWSITQLLSPPSAYLSWTIFQFYDVVALRLIIEKGIGKIIPVSSPGMHISEIAEKAGVPENRLVHIIRQLTIINIFREPKPRTFAHSTASSVLANPGFSSMTDLLLHFSDEGYKCSGYLPEALDLYADKFDKVQKPELRTAFNLAYNTDMHYFDWIYTPENIPHYGDRFGRSMMGGARHELVGVTIESYDWKQFKEGDNIIDVGGGVGHVGVWISEFVKPGVKIIIQDRPSVIEQGKAIHGHIVELQPHNFFEPQPIKGATVYYLRLILHDWPDSICKTILGHIVDAMSEKSKLLIFDAVWQGDDYWMCGKDDEDMVTGWSQSKRHMNIRTLHMMNKLGAKERSEAEWHELLESVGLKITNIYGRGLWQSIVEAVKV